MAADGMLSSPPAELTAEWRLDKPMRRTSRAKVPGELSL